MLQKKYKSIPGTRDNPTIAFPKALVVQIVREVEEGLCRKEACSRYGMAYCTLAEWMSGFGSADYHASKRLHFSIHQRRSIVRAIQQKRMTKAEAHLIHKVGKKTLSSLSTRRAVRRFLMNLTALALTKNYYEKARLKLTTHCTITK
jgi:hypothetical protein